MRTLLSAAALVAALLAAWFQFHVKPVLTVAGYNRVLQPIGNGDCHIIPDLNACEKLVIHQPTGAVYLACSTQASRSQWTPSVDRLNETGRSRDDYVAVYHPDSSKVTRLELINFKSGRGLSLHGMDVVPASADPNRLFVYLVNHRAPPNGQSAKLVGADSVVEIFETRVGSATLTHITTVEHSAIITPNDLIGFGDGKSFYVTNDHSKKIGFRRHEQQAFGLATTSVTYCHTEAGCKFAITKLQSANGIVDAKNGTIYVANASGGGIYVLERQNDNSLVLSEHIKADRCLDNLALDANGAIWAAGFPNAFTLLYKHFADPSIPAPSSALRIAINTGPQAFFGEKYNIDRVFEDDGSLASGTTSAAYDSERHHLFLHGPAAPHLTVCTIS